jgi:hypothetical protein
MRSLVRDTRPARLAIPTLGALAVLVVSACGGGSGDVPTPPSPPPASATAAATTANSSTNACAGIRPFYWEIGDAGGAIVSGTVNSSSDPTVYTATTRMSVASASKWFYSTYFVQRSGGALSASDVKFFNFQSGYTSFTMCRPGQTVQQCVDDPPNGVYTAADDGEFVYGGGHMEKHASLNGLGGLDNAGLAAEIRSQVGNDIALTYSQPQLAGGMATSAADYAAVLRKILRGDLKMHDVLGTHAVCTNPATCAHAGSAPIPPSESWHYSIGHWVEDDPVVGDGAFSSPGAFGFYPWIDRGKTSYGMLARAELGGAVSSVYCGRLIRKAWATATPQ